MAVLQQETGGKCGLGYRKTVDRIPVEELVALENQRVKGVTLPLLIKKRLPKGLISEKSS